MLKAVLTAALLALGTPVLAADPAPAAPPQGLSFDDWAGHARARMMALDANHDGKIDRQEFAARAAMMHGHGKMAATADETTAPKHDGGKMFDRFDANRDGMLDATEINAMLARRFARMDANHDGMLSADERHAMHGMHAEEQ